MTIGKNGQKKNLSKKFFVLSFKFDRLPPAKGCEGVFNGKAVSFKKVLNLLSEGTSKQS
jgi:hypothetical protein